MKIEVFCSAFEANQKEEMIQRAAWRIVRSSEDRLGSGRGQEKLLFAISKLQEEFPDIKGRAEDYIRAAYINFKTETKY